MIITSAEFRCSSQKVSQVPNDGLRDYAFIGRSNVGKSSLINRLTGRKLAKVSGTPGKTRLINHFLTWSIFRDMVMPELRRASKNSFRKSLSIMSKVARRCIFCSCWLILALNRNASTWNLWRCWGSKAYLSALYLQRPTRWVSIS